MFAGDFDFEFYNDTELPDQFIEKLRAEAVQRLLDLTENRTDIIGASVALRELTQAETPHLYQARVVVYMRPDFVAATEKEESSETALKGALSAVERQVRQVREKLGKTWQQPPQQPADDQLV